jgi:hypothetical protein
LRLQQPRLSATEDSLQALTQHLQALGLKDEEEQGVNTQGL